MERNPNNKWKNKFLISTNKLVNLIFGVNVSIGEVGFMDGLTLAGKFRG